MTCPLCGHHFEKSAMVCTSGCPLHKSCGLLCCPNCRYQFVEESSTVLFFKRLFRGRVQPAGGKP